MIVDLYDAIDRMLWAIVAWIAIGAALATPVLLVAAWAVTRAAKRARRALCGACSASDGPEAAPDPREAPEPAGGRTGPHGYDEAA